MPSWEPPPHVFRHLGELLAWFVAVDLFLLAAEFITAYTGCGLAQGCSPARRSCRSSACSRSA